MQRRSRRCIQFISSPSVLCPDRTTRDIRRRDWRAYPHALHVELETGSHLSYGYATAVLLLPEHYLLFLAVQGLVRPMQNLDRVLHVE